MCVTTVRWAARVDRQPHRPSAHRSDRPTAHMCRPSTRPRMVGVACRSRASCSSAPPPSLAPHLGRSPPPSMRARRSGLGWRRGPRGEQGSHPLIFNLGPSSVLGGYAVEPHKGATGAGRQGHMQGHTRAPRIRVPPIWRLESAGKEHVRQQSTGVGIIHIHHHKVIPCSAMTSDS